MTATQRLRSLYFFSFAGAGGLWPFFSLWFADIGLSATQIGGVFLLRPAAMILLPPMWGWLADRYQARRPILIFAALGSAVAALSFLGGASLGWAFFAMALYSVVNAPVIPLSDAAAHAALGAHAHRFARIRVWGSLGFALSAFTLGQLGGTTQPTQLFGSSAVAYVIAALSLVGLQSPEEAPHTTRGPRPEIVRQTLQLIRAPGLRLLLIGGVAYYGAAGIGEFFLGLHLRKLGFDDGFVGLAWLVAVGAEIVTMMFMPRLLEGQDGGRLLALAALASILRWGLLSVASGAALILFTQALHAATFGIWYLAMVRFVQLRAPPALRSTLQSVAQAAHSVGRMLGGILGGLAFDAGGGGWAFQLAAGFSVLSLALYGALARHEPG